MTPSAPRPRVLHLLSCDNWGGTEVQVTTQVVRSDRREVEQVVAFLEPPDVMAARLRAAGVEVHSLAGSGGAAGQAWRLARLLRRGRFDVLEVYGFRAGLVARVARLASRSTKLVIGIRGLHFTEAEEPGGFKTRFTLAVERVLARGVARYDANSEGARQFLLRHGIPDRFTVIRNGVEAEVAQASPRGESVPLIVSTARFVPRKRQEVLLRALAALAADTVDFRCDLIGYGPTQARCEALARELGLDQVRFLGRLSQREIVDRLAEADVFVLNSLWEGMPGSVMEAMSAGLPVVATDVSGTNEVVVDGVTGLLVPADDDRALAGALGRVLRDPELRERMGAAGRARIEHEFSFERVVEEKLALYRDLARV